MSRKGLTDAELEQLLYESGDSEVEDNIEIEEKFTDSESDDSLCDPDYLPEEEDPEEALETCLRKLWEPKKFSKPPLIKKGVKMALAVSEDPVASTSDSQEAVVSFIMLKNSTIYQPIIIFSISKNLLRYPKNL